MTAKDKKIWTGIISDAGRLLKYTEKVRELDASLGSFLSFDPGDAAEGKIPMAIKDNIAVRGKPLTCASRILKNYVAPYTATAVERLEKAGFHVVGKTNLDEFAMGSSTEHSALGVTVNPWDSDRVPGGSSGGSAAAVAAGLVPLALGSDTGGSVRQPAGFCGVYGLKPTYGSISRYGLTAFASSLDVIGLFTRDAALMEEAFFAVCGMDERDQSSLAIPEQSANRHRGKKVAVLKIDEGALDEPVRQACRASAEALKQLGYSVELVDIDIQKYIIPAYYTIATAEASANLARYNGIRYGYAPDFAENPRELMGKARSEGFGHEVKLRNLLGTYVLRSGFQDQYYGRAQKLRTLIRREMDKVFMNHDLLLTPVFPTLAFRRGSGELDEYQQRMGDTFTCVANLTGLPGISIPVGVEGGLPTAVQLMAPAFAEKRLFTAVDALSAVFPLQKPPQFLDAGSL